MENLIDKELVKELMSSKEGVRGFSTKGNFDYIFAKKGKRGLELLEKELGELGCDVKYKDLVPMKFYPFGLETVVLLAIHKVFNFDKEEFKKIGVFSSKVSLAVRLFMKYFVSLESVEKHVQAMWDKYYTCGEISISSIDKKAKQMTIILKDFKTHPFHCAVLEGYFANVLKIITKNEINVKETKCIFNGDEVHEFLLKW